MATKKGGKKTATHRRRIAAAGIVLFSLFLSACGGNFAGSIRSILATSPALVDSLVASGAITDGRAVYIKDLTDLGNGATTLSESFKACDSKPCKLEAVDRYQQLFFDVANRGNLARVGKLARVQVILESLIASARVYFGAAVKRGESHKSVDSLLKELEAEMKA